jgi:hypothetical protein
MAYLIERKAQVLYITASLVKDNGKRRKIVIESRPEYAVITLQGLKEKFPISWEHIFEAARRHDAINLRVEAEAKKQRQSPKKRPS